MTIRNIKLSRRAFMTLGSAAAVGAAGASAGIAIADTTDDIEFSTHRLTFPNLPREFQNYRIGLIGDLHIGRSVPDEWASHAIDTIIKLGVDLLLLAGDYIVINDSSTSRALAVSRNKRLAALPYEDYPGVVYPLVASMLRGKKATDGIVGVFGNHDTWVAPDLCRKSFEEAGIRLLVNESVTITRGSSKLKVLGLDDYWNGYPRWPADTPTASVPSEFRIVLCHNPDLISTILWRTDYKFSLSFAGHTHGGQIALPLVGPLFYNIRDNRFGAGLVKHRDGSMTYTTRGIGVVEIPYRINCRPEASIFELIGS